MARANSSKRSTPATSKPRNSSAPCRSNSCCNRSRFVSAQRTRLTFSTPGLRTSGNGPAAPARTPVLTSASGERLRGWRRAVLNLLVLTFSLRSSSRCALRAATRLACRRIKEDVQRLRAVDAHRDGLFDVGGAARPRDTGHALWRRVERTEPPAHVREQGGQRREDVRRVEQADVRRRE